MTDNKQTAAVNTPKPTANKLKDYGLFREMTKKDIMELDLIHVTLEKRTSAKYGTSISVVANLNPKWKMKFNMSVNQYEVIKFDHPEVTDDKDKHEMHVPGRMLVRYNEDGSIKYRRCELMFTRDIVLSNFFDRTDDVLIERVGYKTNWFADKDVSEAFEAAKAEIYGLFE